MNKLTSYHNVAKSWFKNNHPLVKKWEENNTKWCLHHWDKTLRYNNPKRYDMWLVEDLIPMTDAWHKSMHANNMTEEHKGKNSEANKCKQFSDETRKKISESLKGIKRSEEWRRKLSDSRKGKALSEETRKKMSESRKGEKSPMYGTHRTEETKKKISSARQGIKLPTLYKKVTCIETGKVFDCIKDAKDWVGKGDIGYAIRTGGTAGGYHWMYYKEE